MLFSKKVALWKEAFLQKLVGRIPTVLICSTGPAYELGGQLCSWESWKRAIHKSGWIIEGEQTIHISKISKKEKAFAYLLNTDGGYNHSK